jgi:hypothetical protein
MFEVFTIDWVLVHQTIKSIFELVHNLNESTLVKNIQEINEEARFNMMNLERWGDSLKVLLVINKTIGTYMLNV